MNDFYAYLWMSLGVLVAVIFPVILGFIRKEFPPTAAIGLPPWVKKYGGLLIFSLVTALICLALWKSQHKTAVIEWYTAFLAGFGWEASVEKLVGARSSSPQ